RRLARRAGRQARVLGRLPRARRLVRGAAALLNDEHDLAELAAGFESLVGGGRLLEGEGGCDRHTERAGVEQRQDFVLETPSDERFLLQRASAQRRAEYAGALAHQRQQVELALGACSGADHGQPAAASKRREVLREVAGADQLE